MARKLFVLTLLLCLLLPSVAEARTATESDPVDQIIEQQLQAVDTSDLDSYLRQLEEEYAGLLPDLSLRSVLDSIRKQDGFSFTQVFRALLTLLFRELSAQSVLLIRLLVLALLCVLLQHLHEALAGEVADIAYLICYLVIMGFALQSFGRALGLTRDALTNMLSFVHALFPLLLTVIMAAGNISSAALFNPVLMLVLTAISTLIVNLAVPLIFFAGVLLLANNLSQNLKISRFAYLLRDIGAGIMGVLFMAFVGFNIAQATVGAVADGVALRAGKFAVKTFLPVVGSMIADGYETIAGCTILLGNTLSFVGAVGVLLYCALPAIRIISLFAIYRLVAAVIQPLGGGLLSNALNEISGIFAYFFGALAVVGVMLFILITVIVGTGNSALMLR
ncbi:MAG: stage III sporulation protein AE [Firmicutes bacterium]|nr:stage III sporulation protein AE [Bacillota bacterium]